MTSNRMPEISPNRAVKFWKSISMGGPDECWEWQRSRDRNGYGSIHFGPKGGVKSFVVTRIAYFLTTGIDPGDLFILHSCDNPPCCNPKHLSLGSKLQNTRDAISKGRLCVGEKHCKSRISEIDVHMMREMWFSGLYSQRYIASVYSISPGGADLILRGKKWKHVPMPDGAHPRSGSRAHTQQKVKEKQRSLCH